MSVNIGSPEIHRKEIGNPDLLLKLSKQSKRSKSSDVSSIKLQDPFDRLANKNENKFENDPMLILHKRWSQIARTQESMSKRELLNSYRLLMNDHLRLERFLSILTKDHEVARNRLESDLLDAMMCIEDLKQALEIRMTRRRKVDPREAEERRTLIRQNKKLLNQLFESAKKIEHLELTKLEMKEQLELLDFQVMEMENQKFIIEEELKKRSFVHCKEIQTDDDYCGIDGNSVIKSAEITMPLPQLGSQLAEFSAILEKQREFEKLIIELRRDNSDLREQLVHFEDSENSLTESDKHILESDFRIVLTKLVDALHSRDSKLGRYNEYFQKIQSELPEGVSETFRLDVSNFVESNVQSDPLDTQVALFLNTWEKLVNGSSLSSTSHPGQIESLIINDNEVVDSLLNIVYPIKIVNANDLFKLINHFKNVLQTSPKTDSSQAKVVPFNISLPEELVGSHVEPFNNGELAAEKIKIYPTHSDAEELVSLKPPSYFSEHLCNLQRDLEIEKLQTELGLSERRRKELENRVTDTSEELSRAQLEFRSLETTLNASRRTEAMLRRRLLAAMDWSRSEHSPESKRPYSLIGLGNHEQSHLLSKEDLDLKAMNIKLQTTNTALTEAAQLDGYRLQEKIVVITEMESERRQLLDRISKLQSSESRLTHSLVRIHGLYRELLQDYSEVVSGTNHQTEIAYNHRYAEHTRFRINSSIENNSLASPFVIENSNNSISATSNNCSPLKEGIPESLIKNDFVKALLQSNTKEAYEVH